jgi:hypothetical protein
LSWILPTKYLFQTPQGSLTCRQTLRHVLDGFTAPPNEVVLRTYVALIIDRSAGFEPRTLDSIVSTKNSRPLSKGKAARLRYTDAKGQKKYSSCSFLTSALDGGEWTGSSSPTVSDVSYTTLPEMALPVFRRPLPSPRPTAYLSPPSRVLEKPVTRSASHGFPRLLWDRKFHYCVYIFIQTYF